MTFVSVLMCVYNGESYLREAVNSILTQTFTDFEFIIIDDGSTDSTATILAEYEPKDARLCIHHQTNQGLIASLNKGLELAQGKYIARMDADDVSLPERLAKQVDFLETHPEIDVLGTGVQILDGSGNTSPTLQSPTGPDVLRWCLCFFSPITHPTVMMRRQIVKRVGGYSPDMLYAEDYDLWRRLSCVTRLSNLQDVLLHLRRHDANVSNRHASEQLQNSVRISCLMISHVLNEEVPAGIVQHLWDQEFQTVYDARQVAKLIYRLYQAIVSNGEPTTIEKQTIRRDAAMRLFGLSRPWVQDVSVWGVLARACYLDPLLVLRGAKGLMRRMFTIRSRPL
jgi:glycosyltransferase involved in cell wall biosynthesis